MEVTCSVETLVSPARLYGVVGKITHLENVTTMRELGALSLGIQRPDLLFTVGMNEWNISSSPYAFVGGEEGIDLTYLYHHEDFKHHVTT